VLKANVDGSFHLLLGVPDIGQGLRTVMAQIAAEALGGRMDEISVTLADTSITPWGTTTAASRSTQETGGAVKKAAEAMRGRLLKLASGIMGVPVEELNTNDGAVFAKGSRKQGLTFGEILSHPDVFHSGENVIIIKSTYSVPTFIPPYGTAFAEVEVDTETGMVRVLKMVAASDVGRAINARSVEGQLEGGMHMGIGYALTEELLLHSETGAPLNNNFMDYKLLRAADMPEMEVILVEPVDPNSIYGVKGIGEMAVIPMAPAVRNAVYNATGCPMRELPMTPERLLKALHERGQ